MAKFTMADLLNSQSKKMEERPAFEIRHIPIDKLKPSKKKSIWNPRNRRTGGKY